MVRFSEHIILLLWHYGKVILTSIDDMRGSDTWKFDERGKFTERKKKAHSGIWKEGKRYIAS